ncbi:MAG: DNA primase family protein, partial [Sulfobacillus sp.]
LGSGYCQKGNMSLFAEQSTDRVRNDVACLTGARMLSLSETPDRMIMDEALIKAVSGGDIIKARFLNKEFFEFVPTFTVHIDTNHKPRIRGTEDGIWRRLLLIPWQTKVPEKKKDLSLEQKLLAEKEGILNWIVRGAKDYLNNGLRIPETVRAASDEYRRDEDILGDWFEQCVVSMDGIRESTDVLFKSYQQWCDDSGIRAITNSTWLSRMQDRGIEKRRRMGVLYWYGIGLKGSDYVNQKMVSDLMPAKKVREFSEPEDPEDRGYPEDRREEPEDMV